VLPLSLLFLIAAGLYIVVYQVRAELWKEAEHEETRRMILRHVLRSAPLHTQRISQETSRERGLHYNRTLKLSNKIH